VLASRFLVLYLGASLLLAAPPASFAAARAPISGELSKPGYTVVALAPGGRVKSVRAGRGGFRLRPSAASVTLQLRAPDGKYAGPIVVRGGGKRVIMGVRAGARLGRIRVENGYARVARPLRRRWLDATRTARARRGVPLGAGNYGRVRSRPLAASAARRGAGGDRDSDGVPDELDISDDGDLVLDNFERSRSRSARAAQIAEGPGAPIYLDAQLMTYLEETANVNAAPIVDVDAALRTHGRVDLDTVPRAPTELDCGQPQNRTDPALGGLVYCTRGGSGMAEGAPFPGPAGGKFDPDGNGMGAIGSNSCPIGQDCVSGFQWQHGATSAQIGTGDVLIERAPSTGEAYSGTLQFVFATVPALVSYRDTAGHSATVAYPVAPGGLGTGGNGFPVAPGTDGDIKVTLTVWRPQRLPIAGDACLAEMPTCQWIDVGRLIYTAGFGDGGGGQCPLSAYSTPSGSELGPTTLPDGQGGLADSANDRTASAQNSFTFTVNLSDCLRNPRGYGAPNHPLSWKRGEEQAISLAGGNLLDMTWQVFFFSRSA
jgi:hypothetical protein